MIVTRAHFQSALNSLSFDSYGEAKILSARDRTVLAVFGLRLNPVLVWSLEVYSKAGCPSDTPERAALGLALFNAAPEAFTWDGCACARQPGSDCEHAKAWRAHLIAAAYGAKTTVPA